MPVSGHPCPANRRQTLEAADEYEAQLDREGDIDPGKDASGR